MAVNSDSQSTSIERRRRVMQRSIRLGHCICDAVKPCPCDLFKDKEICLCAGESLPVEDGPVALTTLVDKPGCASKIDHAFLKAVLSGLPLPEDPRVLVGMPAGDDAGVYEIGDGMALVQTVDVFTPSVDDPYTFGQIAAANSVSDVYAMGGRPLTALSIVGFPARKLPQRVMAEILRGGIDKMTEAGVAVIGGHSINEDQIKAGFAVTGIIESSRIARNNEAHPGDVLILTKALGTGVVGFARQIDRAEPAALDAAAQSMARLNRTAAELMMRFEATACTDVTGFGLMGHLTEMALRSNVDVEIIWDDVPWLPGVLQYAADGILPGAIERNRQSCGDRVQAGPQVTDVMLDLCFDAQTSGGLLICMDPAKAQGLLQALHKAGVSEARIIGRVKGEGTGIVEVRTSGVVLLPKPRAVPKAKAEPADPRPNMPCCETASPSGTFAGDIEAEYKRFLDALGKADTLDSRTKQAITVALSVALRCEPCMKAHIAKARDMGFSPAQIDEAAWLGIGFGGSPAWMLYKQVRGPE